MLEIEILPFTAKYFEEVLAVSESEIGKDFIGQDYINFYLYNKNAKGIIALPKNHSEILGFSFFQWCTPDELSKYIFDQKEWIKGTYQKTKLIGYRNLIAVKKEFQNRGVGDELIAFSMNELRKRSPMIASVVWKKKSKDAGILLEKYGLKSQMLIHNYWEKDSLLRKYDCAVCGSPPCKCSAEIYST